MRYILSVIKQSSQCVVELRISTFVSHHRLVAIRRRIFCILNVKSKRKMTPPPRWVFLALLLAGCTAHPHDNACVLLCSAGNRNPEIAGVCEHQQKHVLQSSVGRFQRLFSLCLTPCSGPGTNLDDSELCRSFRNLLIEHKFCSCNDLQDDKKKNTVEEDSTRSEGSFQDPQKLKQFEIEGKLLYLLKKGARSETVEGNTSDNLIMGIEDRDEDRRRSMKAVVANLDTVPADHEGLPDDQVDWEMWCMTQCNKGHGGSACDCDIIP